MKRGTKKLILACIKKYDDISWQIHEILPEDMTQVTVEQTKAILEIDGMEFFHALGKIKDTYTQLYVETEDND
jgi:hypothetical protein